MPERSEGRPETKIRSSSPRHHPRGSRRRARTSAREATVVRTSREPPCPHTSPCGRITRAAQAWDRDPGGRGRAARSSRYQGGRLIRSTTRTEVEVPARCANAEDREHLDGADARRFGDAWATCQFPSIRRQSVGDIKPFSVVSPRAAGGRRRPGPTRPRWCAAGAGGVKDGTHRAASAGLGRPRARG